MAQCCGNLREAIREVYTELPELHVMCVFSLKWYKGITMSMVIHKLGPTSHLHTLGTSSLITGLI